MTYDPLNDGISAVTYVSRSGDDLMAVNAARVSLAGYDDWTPEGDLPGRSKKLLRYLLRHGHWSPFDQPWLTLRIKAPIFVRTQVFRHSSLKFNEVSARYTEAKEAWYVPARGQYRQQAGSNRQASEASDGRIPHPHAEQLYAEACQLAYENYLHLLKLGVAREQARGVLPQSMYTEFIVSGTLRSWLHFLQARLHPGAQFETQQFAQAICEIVGEFFPETLAAFEEIEAEETKNAEDAEAFRALNMETT